MNDELVQQLRALADQLEDGDFGDECGVSVVLIGDGRLEMFGMGTVDNAYSAIATFELGKNRLVNMVSGSVLTVEPDDSGKMTFH